MQLKINFLVVQHPLLYLYGIETRVWWMLTLLAVHINIQGDYMKAILLESTKPWEFRLVAYLTCQQLKHVKISL
jgi:hypothetical protein